MEDAKAKNVGVQVKSVNLLKISIYWNFVMEGKWQKVVCLLIIIHKNPL